MGWITRGRGSAGKQRAVNEQQPVMKKANGKAYMGGRPKPPEGAGGTPLSYGSAGELLDFRRGGKEVPDRPEQSGITSWCPRAETTHKGVS